MPSLWPAGSLPTSQTGRPRGGSASLACPLTLARRRRRRRRKTSKTNGDARVKRGKKRKKEEGTSQHEGENAI